MRMSRPAVFVALFSGSALGAIACAEPAVEIRIHPDSAYQTMTGWESHTQSGEVEIPSFNLYRDELFDRAVGELGITRLRLQAYSGIENGRDYFDERLTGAIDAETWLCKRFETTNDDDDPTHIRWEGFRFSQFDTTMERVVLPIRRRLEQRGERLYLNVNYNAFVKQCPGTSYHHLDSADEYAEFALAVFLHLRDRYGMIPDAWELILEPEHTDWTGRRIGEALVKTAQVLERHGFTPDFIAPSTASMANAPVYLDDLASVPGAIELLDEFSYHRYGGVSPQSFTAIRERARRFGLRTSMLEHIGSGEEDLYKDLTMGNVSSWQQFALAYGGRDDAREGDRGGAYYIVSHARTDSPSLRPGQRTRYLREYFRHIRPGDRRIGATSSTPSFEPVAMLDSAGQAVVVIRSPSGATIEFPDLPAGEYAVSWTTADTSAQVNVPPLRAGDTLRASLPGEGVIAVFPKARAGKR